MRLRTFVIFALSCPIASQQQGPVNPGFENGAPGQVPPGWFVPTSDFSAEVRREGCAAGSGCAVLYPRAAVPSQPFGNLMQAFAALPFRGKQIRLRASIRVEQASSADRAQMWRRVDRTGRQFGLFDNMDDRPIQSSEWKTYEIGGEVDSDAQSINIGVMLIGRGKVWIDDVRFEIVPQREPSPEEAAALARIAALYARLNKYFESGRFDKVLGLAAPDAQAGTSIHIEPLATVLGKLKQEQGEGIRYSSWRTEIKGLRLFGTAARLSVEDRVTRISPDGRSDYVSTGRDVWLKTRSGWKLKELVRTSGGPIASKPDPKVTAKVVAELKQRAVPLAGVEAGHDAGDLAAFGRAVGDARVVALGEASHGSREFFQMKHRLLEYLVKEKGFTVFAIEANWPEALAVDRYVKTGEGDAASAMAQMYFWTWYTEEVRDMVEWMRRFNQAPGDHPTLTFTSFDMQTAPVAGQKALSYLKTVAPAEASKAEAIYSRLTSLSQGGPDEKAAGLAKETAVVVAAFDAGRQEMEKNSSPEAWRDARQAAVIVQQACEVRVPGKAGSYRDEMMAANVGWLLKNVHPNEKVVLWAHNYHVSKGQQSVAKSMGAWLRESLGEQMYVAGFAFRRGQVRAIGRSAGGTGSGLSNHDVPPAPEGSGGAVLGAAGLPLFFLDMRTLPAAGALRQWLSESHLFYDTGAVWQTSDPESNLRPEVLLKSYDGLIYVDECHAARGLAAIRQ